MEKHKCKVYNLHMCDLIISNYWYSSHIIKMALISSEITFRKLAINAVKIIKYTQLLQVYNTYLTYFLSYSGIYDSWYFLQKLTDTKQYLCHHSVYMWHVRVICLAKFWLGLMSFFYKKYVCPYIPWPPLTPVQCTLLFSCSHCIHFIYFLLVHFHNNGPPQFHGGS